jgi:thioredoxin 1
MTNSFRTRSVVVAGILLLCIGLGIAVYSLSRPAASAMVSAEDAVQQVLLIGKPAVVEFGANACASFREMKPILAGLAREHREQIAVVDLDIVKQPQYIARYKIQLMPTQVFYGADGKELGRHMGKISGDEILARLGVSPVARAP